MTEILWLSKRGARLRRASLRGVVLRSLIGAGALAVLAAGFGLGRWSGSGPQLPAGAALVTARQEVARAARDAQAQLDAIASRVSLMQAQLLRVEAVGKRVVEAAGLDAEEFAFDAPPPMGGVEDAASVLEDETCPAGGLVKLGRELDRLEADLVVRSHQIGLMEGLLGDRKVTASLSPSGWPVAGGWISSHYGYRADPLTGKRLFHQGIDIAGRRGSPVRALAGGLVTRSGRRAGYGRMVEIDHGNGYRTRYAHNASNLVSVGQMVRQGEMIARLGESGRATGPHVHVELLRNERHLNPKQALSRLQVAGRGE